VSPRATGAGFQTLQGNEGLIDERRRIDHPVSCDQSLEALALRLASTRRTARTKQPFFIELAGTPRAGKTTTLSALAQLLCAAGVRVKIVTERALDCPIPRKRDPAFNIWTFCATMTEVLEEAQHRKADFVLVDRGLVDAVCWMDWYRETGCLRSEEHRVIERFMLLRRWAGVLGLVLVMTVEPAVAIERDMAQGAGPRPGPIMNDVTLHEFNQSLTRVRDRISRGTPIVEFDTSRLAREDVLRHVMYAALKHFTPRSSAESVLVVPRRTVRALLREHGFIPMGATVSQFMSAIRDHGLFVDRQDAEADPAYIQPISIGYMRTRTRVLVVPRSGRNGPHGRDATHAIWVGGHVRNTDGPSAMAIGRGLLREIEEETGITRLSEPSLVGLVLDEPGRLPSMHVGVVHRLHLDGSAVNALPGDMVDAPTLMSRLDDLEPWSRSIVLRHLRRSAGP
jgi:predicted NUDIX family phosphoesterase